MISLNTPAEQSIVHMEKWSGSTASFDVQFVSKCRLEPANQLLIHFLDWIIRMWIIEWAGYIKTLILQQDLALMATDRDVNECGLGVLDAIVKRKNSRAVLCPHEAALEQVQIQLLQP